MVFGMALSAIGQWSRIEPFKLPLDNAAPSVKANGHLPMAVLLLT
jgi:hypothetical protein